MNGGYRFFEDLKEKLNRQTRYLQSESLTETIQLKPSFVKLASYVDTASTGEVQGIELLEGLNITGKNVLLVEDMIDSGTTMKAVLNKIGTLFHPK
mmetsp:Transcript_14869/g.18646  ORF Transcript_14869/g.18646 Transcript_14869/m.18646 type:complete len:96 (+) Transcript_14869:290-577(+)